MKRIFLILFFLFCQLAYAEVSLYTADELQAKDLNSMTEILEGFIQDHPEKNILFYIHGRNHHVEKEWNKIKVMEEAYNIKIVMLHWDAWSGLLSRAVSNAMYTSEPLSMVLSQIKDFKFNNPQFFSERKISLLCHSMGNLVLKTFTEKWQDSEFEHAGPIFDNYISVGADVPMKNHDSWLEKFKLARQKIVTMNDHDIVLLLSYSLDLKAKNPFEYKLGLGFDNYPGKKDATKEKLVPEVHYVDFSGVLKTEHSYNLPKTPLIKHVFNKLTNGESFTLNEKELKTFKVKLKKEKNLFYLKKD